jgi:hypothetical protein
MGGTGIFGWLGDTLFGASPYAPTQRAPNITPDPPGALGGGAYGGGLLDPRGIREQALWQGLGALSSGLIAAGQRRPATQPSLLPQALGAFQPAYAGALQSGYQQAAAERQMLQQQQDDALIEAYRRSNPAYANYTRAALAAQMARTPPTGFEPDPNRPGALRQIVGGPEDLNYRAARAAAERDPLRAVDGQLIDTRQLPTGGGPQQGQQPGTSAPASAPGQPLPPVPGRAPPTNPMALTTGQRDANGNLLFRDFTTPDAGIQAAQAQLLRNAERLRAAGLPVNATTLTTHPQFGWAAGDPRNIAYPGTISRFTGLPVDAPLDLANPQVMAAVTQGIIRQEGVPPPAGTAVQRAAAPPQVQVAQAGGPTATAAAPAPAPPPSSTPVPAAVVPPALAPPLAPPPVATENLVLRQTPGALLPGPSSTQVNQAHQAHQSFYSSQPVQQALRTVTVLRAMEDAAPRATAASDLNLIYGLMTILDPGSVVRDPETGMVRATQSADQRLLGMLNQLQGGAALAPEARAAIMTEARGRVGAYLETTNLLRDNTESLLRSSNLNPAAVLGQRLTMPAPARLPEPSRPPAAPPSATASVPGGAAPQPAPLSTAPSQPEPGALSITRPAGLPPPPLPPAQAIEMMSGAALAALAPRTGEMNAAQLRALEIAILREESIRARSRGAR